MILEIITNYHLSNMEKNYYLVYVYNFLCMHFLYDLFVYVKLL